MNRNKKINTFIKALKSQGLTLAVAESMTCGLASHLLSTCKGTSDVLLGSIVCYSSEVKTNLFSISANQIRKYTAESKEITQALAVNLSGIIRADISAAITGLASAGGSETRDKPVGTVFFAIRYKGRNYNYRKIIRGTPQEIRIKACLELYELIIRTLEHQKKNGRAPG
jgi:nicotinamide-nucleotide amidase